MYQPQPKPICSHSSIERLLQLNGHNHCHGPHHCPPSAPYQPAPVVAQPYVYPYQPSPVVAQPYIHPHQPSPVVHGPVAQPMPIPSAPAYPGPYPTHRR